MKKQILIGADSFEKIIGGNYFYVDKTLFIKELLENRGEVTLITRPHRFGKTLNMSMLECFFDINRDSKALFDRLKIMEHKDIVEKHLNKYPVISLTLKNVEEDTYKNAIENIRDLISGVYRQNRYLYESDRLDEQQKEIFYTLLSGKSTESRLKSALKFLTECLYTYHKERVIVLLDEYDAPITNALMKGYYDKMISFMRGFMGSVFKTNKYLKHKELDNYWVNTGSVRELQDVFYKGDAALKNELAGLLTGAPVMMRLEDGITYPIKYVRSNTFWTMLLNAGYLRASKIDRFGAELVNMEVKSIFSRYAEEWFGEQH